MSLLKEVNISLTEMQLWELSQFVIVSKYELGVFHDFLLPYIWTKTYYGSLRVPLIGFIDLIVSEEKYCINCFKKHAGVSHFCKECLSSDFGALLKCIWNGPYENYGVLCDPVKSPVCESLENADYCIQEQVVYLGMIGDLLKVGTAKLDRDGSNRGYINRLLEQGLEVAVVFKGKINLPISRYLETKLSERFNAQMSISFEEKLEAISSRAITHKVQRGILSSIAETVLLEYSDFNITSYELFELYDYYLTPRRFDYYLSEYNRIVGKVIGFQGNILFVEHHGELIAYNAHHLIGRRILTPI